MLTQRRIPFRNLRRLPLFEVVHIYEKWKRQKWRGGARMPRIYLVTVILQHTPASSQKGKQSRTSVHAPFTSSRFNWIPAIIGNICAHRFWNNEKNILFLWGVGGNTILIKGTFNKRQHFWKEPPVAVYLPGCQGARFLLCLRRLIPKCLWQVDESVSYGHLSLYPTCQSGNELSIPSKITFDLARWRHWKSARRKGLRWRSTK